LGFAGGAARAGKGVPMSPVPKAYDKTH